MPANLEKVEVLIKMAQAKGYSASQLAIAWLLQQGKDIIPIVGMSKRSRIADNLQALHIEFTVQELAQLSETFALNAMQGARYSEAFSSLEPS